MDPCAQIGPIQKRTQGGCLQFLFPSPHEAAVFPSAMVAQNMCWVPLPKLLDFDGCFSSENPLPLSWWLSCVDGSSVSGPSGCGLKARSKTFLEPFLELGVVAWPLFWHPTFLEDRNLLKLRSLDPSCPCFLSDNNIWGQWTQMLQMLWSQG